VEQMVLAVGNGRGTAAYVLLAALMVSSLLNIAYLVSHSDPCVHETELKTCRVAGGIRG